MAATKNVFITGANTGMGYETVKALINSNASYRIFLGTRSLERGQAAIDTLQKECPNFTDLVELIQVDLDSDESIEHAFNDISSKVEHLDVLINNAAVSFEPHALSGKITKRECFNKEYNTNVAGTHVLTWTFVPLLLKSPDPRLLFIAGLSHLTIASEHYFPTPELPAGWPKQMNFEVIGYRCSKTALNMLMVDWAHKLKTDGVKVWGVFPGFLATDLGDIKEVAKKMGARHPSVGGKLALDVVEGNRDQDVGKIVQEDGITPF